MLQLALLQVVLPQKRMMSRIMAPEKSRKLPERVESLGCFEEIAY
jgi:hypothetical protein